MADLVGAVHGDLCHLRDRISWTAVAPFTLALIVLIVVAIANLGGTASWTTDVAKAGGWFALLDSFAAGYLGATIVINVSMGKEYLPLGKAA